MSPPLGDLAPFLIGDAGYRTLYAKRSLSALAGSHAGPRTLVRETADGLRVCIYLPDELVARLEARPPQRGLDDGNVDAFAALVEEVDHFLCIAERAAARRSCTLFELELHANVSKHLVLGRFLAAGDGRRGLDRPHRIWLHWHLFHKPEWSDPDPRVRARYRDAARWALRYLDGLDRTRGGRARLDALRRFHGADSGEKIDLIRAMWA